MEGLIKYLWKKGLGVDLPDFPRIPLRRGDGQVRRSESRPARQARIHRADRHHETVDFKACSVARPTHEGDGRGRSCACPAAPSSHAKEIDDYTAFVAIYGAKGLAWIKVNDVTKLNDEGLQSPVVKFLTPDSLKAIIERSGARTATSSSSAQTARRSSTTPSAPCARRSAISMAPSSAFSRRLQAVLGGGLPVLRVRRREQALRRRAPPVHEPEGRPLALLDTDPSQGARQGLRRGDERLGTRRRLGTYPPP